MSYDFEQRFVGRIDVFEFDVEHGIDPVLAQQRAKAILETEPGEYRALCRGRLAVQIKLRSPPRLHAIFQLQRISQESIATIRRSGHRLESGFEVSRLLHLVGI